MHIKSTEDNEKTQKARLSIIGLFLAFVPSAILLAVRNGPVGAFGGACLLSLICCIASSFMLLRRATVWSILLAVVFLVLNLGISLLLGCGAALG